MSVLWTCGQRAYFFRGHKQVKRCSGVPGDRVGRTTQVRTDNCPAAISQRILTCCENWSLELGEWLLLWIPIGLSCPTNYLFVRTALLLPHPRGSAHPALLGTPDYPGVSTCPDGLMNLFLLFPNFETEGTSSHFLSDVTEAVRWKAWKLLAAPLSPPWKKQVISKTATKGKREPAWLRSTWF